MHKAIPISPQEAILASSNNSEYDKYNLITNINFWLIKEIRILWKNEKKRELFQRGQELIQIRVDYLPIYTDNFMEYHSSPDGRSIEEEFQTDDFLDEYGWVLLLYREWGWKAYVEEGTKFPYFNFFIDPDFCDVIKTITDIQERFKLIDME